MRLLPRMALEAPPGYVEFVERHLPRLRRDATLVVGEGRRADELYPDVLSDVAQRWTLLEWQRRWLRRPGAAEDYLRRAFARRARRWQDEQITPVHIEVWQVESLPAPLLVDGWHPEHLAPLHARLGRQTAVAPLWSTMALRLAPVLLAAARLEVRPLAEAAVAWWHAYEAHRRRRQVAAVTAFTLLFILLSQASLRDAW